MNCIERTGRRDGATNVYRRLCLGRWAYSLPLLILVGSGTIISDTQYENCTGIVTSIADANCDIDNNIQSCEYDGGDCCPSTCKSTDSAKCITDTRECINPEAADYPYADVENCAGTWRYINDGYCDKSNNNADCGYDGGDCCPSSCDNSMGLCPEDGSECVDPDADDFSYAGYENCSGYIPYAGNGRCNDENNNAECDYDGGDCCKCTCVSGDFACETSPLDCVDPRFMDNDGCDNVKPCSTNVPQHLVVRNTADASGLARSIKCSGGVFSVEWIGHVIVNETIWVTDQTTLNIKGDGVMGTAIADGNDTTRIIGVENATLHLENIHLTHGFTYAGALSVDYSNVTFSGDIAFINNTSISTGAIRVMNGGNLSSDGNLAFINNTGRRRAGAITILSSYTSFRGTTTFEGNNVDAFGRKDGYCYGGAIYASDQSRLSWSGNTTFIHNSVTSNFGNRTILCFGGAVAADSGSSVSWTGRTNFTGNMAVNGGGALYANSTAIFAWTDETAFTDNSAEKGGAVLLTGSSAAFWFGATTFKGNKADIGGALFVAKQSRVIWSANTIFYDNKANSNGGAIYVRDNSDVECQGTTMFERNVASEGGALYIEDGPTTIWNNSAIFAHNVARVQGGAIYVFTPTLATDETYIHFNGPTRFLNNSGGTYGGGLMVSGSVTLATGYGVLEFDRNRAGSTGGAVLFTGVGIGPTFRESKFVANTAKIGGAVYATGTGTTISVRGESCPLTFDGCNFTGNIANSTGGAVESAAGQDYFVNTYFIRNAAEQGGALRLAGTASIVDCSFEQNHAAENGGPAISNVAKTANITSSYFFGNNFNCDPGYFLYFEKGERYPIVCLGCTDCNNCTLYDNATRPKCEEALEHTESSGGGVMLDTLQVNQGFWRATPMSWEILECYNQDACLGGITDSADYCATGYEGPYCAVCSHGYTESLSYTCRKCSDHKASILAWLVLPSTLALSLLLYGYMVSKDRRTANRGCLKSFQKLPLQSIKILIVAWQIMTELASVANISFPKEYKIFLEGVNFFNFDIGLVMSAGCFIEIDFHGRLIMTTVGPIVALGVLALTYKIALHRNRGSGEAIEIVRKKHVFMALWITFLVYSSVSSVVFQMFSCEILDDGERYLRADYGIACDSSKHRSLQIYAAFMILLYPVGIPLAYIGLLYFSRDALKTSAAQDTTNIYVKAAFELSSPYQPGAFYYEVVECARRATLTGAIVFVLPYEMGQVAVTLILIMVFALCSESLAPYRSSWETWISRIGHVVVFLAVFVGFIVSYVNEGQDSHRREEGYGRALVVVNLCWIVAVVVEGVTTICSDIPTPDHLPRMISGPRFTEDFCSQPSDSAAFLTTSEATRNVEKIFEKPRFRQSKSFPMPRLERRDSGLQ